MAYSNPTKDPDASKGTNAALGLVSPKTKNRHYFVATL
jgi:hypothetical protein